VKGVLRVRQLLLALLALASLVGCGPIQSTSALIEADVDVEAARSAGAPASATYEYVGAEAYLHKAREEAGKGQYDSSTEFARKASELARAARAKALEATQKESP
jgi:hypothetical protein